MTTELWIALGSIGAIFAMVLWVSWDPSKRTLRQVECVQAVSVTILMGLILFAAYTVFA